MVTPDKEVYTIIRTHQDYEEADASNEEPRCPAVDGHTECPNPPSEEELHKDGS